MNTLFLFLLVDIQGRYNLILHGLLLFHLDISLHLLGNLLLRLAMKMLARKLWEMKL